MKKSVCICSIVAFVLCSVFSFVGIAEGYEENLVFDFMTGNENDFVFVASGSNATFEMGENGVHFSDASTGRQGGYPFANKKFPSPNNIDGDKCFAVKIVMRHEKANYNPDSASKGSTPKAALYFSGINKSTGKAFNINGANVYIFDLVSSKDSNDLYTSNGKYVTYFLETSKFPGWNNADINGIRFDPIKDGVGEGDIASMTFFFKTSIDSITADGGENGMIPGDADTLSLTFSTPILQSSIEKENIVITDDTGIPVTVNGFTFDQSNNKLDVELGEILKDGCKYSVNILDVDVNSSVHFDTVEAEFTTLPPLVSVKPSVTTESITFEAENTDECPHRILTYLTVWEGDVFKKSDSCIIEIPAGGENNQQSLSVPDVVSNQKIEVYIYDITQGYPKFAYNDILVIQK